mmetsp:Transcript_18021/g.54264  ORF Transcript_18021/g.54264 Transcript_18021/m.54264 type:complete len:740 (-) Transcript_18021:877-3096(-)
MYSLQHDSCSSQLQQDSMHAAIGPDLQAALEAMPEAPAPEPKHDDLKDTDGHVKLLPVPFDRSTLDRDSAQGTWVSPKSGKLGVDGAASHQQLRAAHAIRGSCRSTGLAAGGELPFEAGWDDLPQDLQRSILQMTIEDDGDLLWVGGLRLVCRTWAALAAGEVRHVHKHSLIPEFGGYHASAAPAALQAVAQLDLSGVPSSRASHRSGEWLALSHLVANLPTLLPALCNLTLPMVDDTTLSTMPWEALAPRLTDLSLWAPLDGAVMVKVTDPLAAAGKLRSLTLHVADTWLAVAGNLTGLGCLSGLQRLTLSGGCIDLATLRPLASSLTHLDLAARHQRVAAVCDLTHLTALRSLKLPRHEPLGEMPNSVREEVMAFLAAPQLDRLEASTDAAHFGRSVPVLQQLTNVTHFTLRQDVASAVQLVGVLKKWPRLESLRLPRTGLYNQSLLEVTGASFLRGLTALDLSSSFVFDWSLWQMASLTGLRALSIVHELPLSEAALAAVAALPRLQALAVARKGVHPVLAPGAAAAAATFGDGRHLLALTACTGLTCLRWDQSQIPPGAMQVVARALPLLNDFSHDVSPSHVSRDGGFISTSTVAALHRLTRLTRLQLKASALASGAESALLRVTTLTRLRCLSLTFFFDGCNDLSRKRMVEALAAMPHLQARWLDIRGSPPSPKLITSSSPPATAASRIARGSLLLGCFQPPQPQPAAADNVIPAGAGVRPAQRSRWLCFMGRE